VTLENIKSQGLACVEFEEEEETEAFEEKTSEKEHEKRNTSSLGAIDETEVIRLNFGENNSKDIKTNINTELRKKSLHVLEGYSLYVFLAFCVLIVGLLLSKWADRKNEFR
jgi:hypothetical protein